MSWLHRVLGKDGTSQAGVEPGASASQGGALRASQRPWEYGGNGHYRFSVVTGTLAAALAANAVVFSARWSHASKLAVIVSFKTRFMPLTAFTAATLDDHTSFDAFINTGFTAAHTGGTALTLTGTALKTRQSMAATQFADIRIASTAALGGGTLTATAHPFAQTLRKGNRVNPAAATEEIIMPTTDDMDIDFDVTHGGHPEVLSQDMGITVRNRRVWPAAGTGILQIQMAWAEVDAFA